jgi:hexosaminidase
MKYLITGSLIVFSVLLNAQEVNIIPQPVSLKIEKGHFIITKKTVIAYNDFTKNAAYFLQNFLNKNYGLYLQLTMHNRDNKKAILLMSGGEQEKKGFYELKCDNIGISIGGDKEGVFSGVQTLIQLLPPENQKTKNQNLQLSIPQLSITDYPRFAYRGMHLDCARHFWSVDFIKKYLDYLALHKFNTFHWHLTDDQGWRIEIKKYPKLISVGGWRNGTIIGRYPGTGNDGFKYGGYYTQEQIKEIVKYAADRYIDVIPEIEMPGHASAAIAAYPELSCFPNEPTIKFFPKQCKWSGDSSGKQVQQTWGVFDDVFCAGQENTFKFLEDVMEEVLALFPSKYIHVGGDECPKDNWKRCTHCQQRMKDNKLKDEHELQSYFIQRMEKYLNKKGRTLIGWDEILEGGLAPNAVVMSWRGEKGGIDAAKENHDVIMTPGNPVYFDHTQSENEDSVTIGGFNPIEKVYAYEPVPKELNEEQAKHVLGAQANMWTEYMKNTQKVEYMLFPRIAALSEVLWSKKENKNWDDFQSRLLIQLLRYKSWNINYSKALFEPKTSIEPSLDNNGVIWKFTTKDNSEINVAEEVFPKTKEKGRLYNPGGELIKKSCTMIASYSTRFNDYTIVHLKQKFTFNKATGKKITLNSEASKNYPGDGAFTLVNGVQNEKGFARTKEFLGFSGKDCEATIDLGKTETISEAVVHCLRRTSSWIWRPLTVEVQISTDGSNYTFAGLTDDFIVNKNSADNGTMKVSFDTRQARFIKIIIKCWDEIPVGEPGAGKKPWLFVDEIEVD